MFEIVHRFYFSSFYFLTIIKEKCRVTLKIYLKMDIAFDGSSSIVSSQDWVNRNIMVRQVRKLFFFFLQMTENDTRYSLVQFPNSLITFNPQQKTIGSVSLSPTLFFTCGEKDERSHTAKNTLNRRTKRLSEKPSLLREFPRNSSIFLASPTRLYHPGTITVACLTLRTIRN